MRVVVWVLLALVVSGCGGLTDGSEKPHHSPVPEGAYLGYERVAHNAFTGNLSTLCVPPQVVGASCGLVEGKPALEGCTCEAPARPASDAAREAVKGKLCDAPGRSACADLCLCERDVAKEAFALDERCPLVEPYGFSVSPDASDVLFHCNAVSSPSYDASAVKRGVGEACAPSIEQDAQASMVEELSLLDVGSPQCESGLCLAYDFQGRTDCPYGTLEGDCSEQGGPSVTGAVVAQHVGRRAARGVTCSCRCDGPNPCACPSGMVCEPLFSGLEVASPAAGAYCVFPPSEPSALCSEALANCED